MVRIKLLKAWASGPGSGRVACQAGVYTLCSQLGLEGGHVNLDEVKSFSPFGGVHGLHSVLLDLAQLRLVLQQCAKSQSIAKYQG